MMWLSIWFLASLPAAALLCRMIHLAKLADRLAARPAGCAKCGKAICEHPDPVYAGLSGARRSDWLRESAERLVSPVHAKDNAR